MADYLAPGHVHIGSVLDLAGRLEPQSVQTIVTSPPYFGLRSYLPADHPGKAHELGSEATPEAFVANLVAVFAALRACLKDDGTIWLNIGDSYNAGRNGGHPGGVKQWKPEEGKYQGQSGANVAGVPPKSLLMIPHRVALALQADGWVVRQDVVWSKPNPMPESVTDRPTRAHEYIFLIAKGPRYYYDATAIAERATQGELFHGDYAKPGIVNVTAGSNGRDRPNNVATTRNKRSVWTVPPAQFADAHYATFAPDLIRPCILAGTSERGECAACGRAWVRETERTIAQSHRAPGSTWQSRNQARFARGGAFTGHSAETTGWRPQCACPPGTPTRSQLVLDPFLGSGTVAEVAHEEGRRWIGLDLDERARRWTADRLAKLPVGRLFA